MFGNSKLKLGMHKTYSHVIIELRELIPENDKNAELMRILTEEKIFAHGQKWYNCDIIEFSFINS